MANEKEIRQRFYWQKNADGSRTKVYYYPVTSAEAVVMDSEGNSLADKWQISDSKCASKLEVDEVKTNGNIVLKDGSGNKKEYMSATPSGDILHYSYIECGAVWNDTDSDIVKQDWFGDNYTHKSKMWALNGLGDITNEEMRAIYNAPHLTGSFANALYQSNKIRTNISLFAGNSSSYGSFNMSHTFYNLQNAETLCLDIITRLMISTSIYMFRECKKVKKIYGILKFTSSTASYSPISYMYSLEDVLIKEQKYNISFSESPNISKRSILYLIQNATNGTTNITIKLHPTAYAMASADNDIQDALTTNGYISLISA